MKLRYNFKKNILRGIGKILILLIFIIINGIFASSTSFTIRSNIDSVVTITGAKDKISHENNMPHIKTTFFNKDYILSKSNLNKNIFLSSDNIDTIPPFIINTIGNSGENKIDIFFNEEVPEETIFDKTNYEISGNYIIKRIEQNLSEYQIVVPQDYSRIQDAIDNAKDGDTIFVKSGNYYENIVINKNILLIGENRRTTRIESGDIVLSMSDSEIRNFTITTGGAVGKIDLFGNCILKNCVIKDFITNKDYSGIIHLYNSNIKIFANLIENNISLHYGIILLMANAKFIQIKNNLIYGNKVNYNNNMGAIDLGWDWINNRVNVKVVNNIIINNNSGGIYARGERIIKNNIIINNRNIGIINCDNADYNNVWNNGTDYSNGTPGIHNISTDPLFKDAENGDYTLKEDSPCIDAGDPGIYDRDGSRSDIGAYGGPTQEILSGLKSCTIILDSLLPKPGTKITITTNNLEDLVGNKQNNPQSFYFYTDDGNSNPTIIINNALMMNGKDILIKYKINDAEKDTIEKLQLEYSLDNNNWKNAHIFGDTMNIDSSKYIGEIIWKTEQDLPTYQGKVSIRLSVKDSDPYNWGKSNIISISIDNNIPPEILIDNINIKQKEDINISFILSDAEKDTLSIVCEYFDKINSNWKLASITGNDSLISNYDSQIIWKSGLDLPNGVGLYKFRITPYDNDPGIADTIIIKIDQLGVPEVKLIHDILGEQNGDIQIQYVLSDDEKDNIDLFCEYSIDSGVNWLPATVTGDISNIDSLHYNGSLIWQSETDIPGIDKSTVRFKITPNDGHNGFEFISNNFHVDNNEVPAISLREIETPNSGIIKIPVTVSDAENDTIQLSISYSIDGNNWSENKVIPKTFIPSQYNDTLYWNSVNYLGFGEFTNVKLKITPLDNDSGLSVISNTIKIYNYSGDYSGDIKINYDDLLIFTEAWWSQDLSKEIGPATGEPPLLIPEPDGKIDFEDLMVLAQQWNWSFDNPELTKKSTLNKLISNKNSYCFLKPITEKNNTIFNKEMNLSNIRGNKNLFNEQLLIISQSEYNPWEGKFGQRVSLQLDTFAVIKGFEIIIEYDKNSMEIEKIENSFLKNQKGFTFKGNDKSAGKLIINSFSLNKTEINDSLLTLRLKFLEEKNVPIKIYWRIHDKKNQLLSSGFINYSLEGHISVPQEFALLQNYPNPFNATTTIRYQLPEDSKVRIDIYNTLGQKIKTILNKTSPAGYYKIQWDINESPFSASGIYFVRMAAKSTNRKPYIKVIKVLIIK